MLTSPVKEGQARKYAEELLASLPTLSCPVPLEQVAIARGIKRIVKAKLDSDGFLFKDRRGFAIYVNRILSEARHRFTCAHEIGHTYFEKTTAGVLSHTDKWESLGCLTEFVERDKEEEYLCDVFAVELLMPSALVQGIVEREQPSFRCIHALTSLFKVSTSAAAWRMCELAHENIGIIWFKLMGKPSNSDDIKLRLDWGTFPQQSRIYLPRFDAVRIDSLISKCLASGQILEGFERLSFGTLRQTHYLKCKRFGKSVLCLVSPTEPYQSRQSDSYITSLSI